MKWKQLMLHLKIQRNKQKMYIANFCNYNSISPKQVVQPLGLELGLCSGLTHQKSIRQMIVQDQHAKWRQQSIILVRPCDALPVGGPSRSIGEE